MGLPNVIGFNTQTAVCVVFSEVDIHPLTVNRCIPATYFHYVHSKSGCVFHPRTQQSVSATAFKNTIYLPGFVIHEKTIHSSKHSQLNN